MTLFVHETHRVVGARADEHEAAFRDRLMPTLAEGGDARLLHYLHHAHGTGRAYTVVTVTAVRDGTAWEALHRRLREGDLASWSRDLDALVHRRDGKVLVPVPWSPVGEVDLDTVSVDPAAQHELTLFMEDTGWPYDGGLAAYLEALRTQYAPMLEASTRSGGGMLELRAVLQPAWGAGSAREVVLWQKVRHARAVTALVGSEVPPEHRAPGMWMHDALAVRDDWESRLLRTTRWSPWH